MLLLPGLVHAATVTEIPTFLRGDAGLAYAWDRTGGPLVERDAAGTDVEVGRRAVDVHRMDWRIDFGAAPGTAVYVVLPHYVAQTVGYGSTTEMVYDPATESGTYVGTDEGATGTFVHGGGLGGVWLGVRGTPFSEVFEDRRGRATWLLDLGVRTPDRTNLWVDGESRGAGPGSTGIRLGTAFSTTIRAWSPYLQGAVTWQSPIDVETSAGTVAVDPGTAADVRFGTEATFAENETSGGLVRADLHADLRYQAAGAIPSGVYLPNVLEVADGVLVQEAERMEGGVGLTFVWRPMGYLQFHLGADFAFGLPQRVESPYPVYTAGSTLHSTLGTGVTVRLR